MGRQRYTPAKLLRACEIDAARFWRWVSPEPDARGCRPWFGSQLPKGYGSFRIGGAGSRKQGAHRVAYALTHGECPAGVHVRHTCDNPVCCAPEHLIPGTNADNVRDAKERGRHAHGERHGSAKLSDAEVIQIRDLRAEGVPASVIADRFDVTANYVYHLASRRPRIRRALVA